MELYIITLAIGFLVTKHIEVDVVHCLLACGLPGRSRLAQWPVHDLFLDR